MKKQEHGSITVNVDLGAWMESSVEDRIEQGIVQQLSTKLENRIDQLVQSRMLALVDKEFEKLAKCKVEEFFLKAQRKTNTWGEPIGEPVSFREILLDRFTKYMDERVDEKGNTSTSSFDRERGLTRSQWLLNQIAHKPLQDAVNATVKTIADKAKQQIQESVSRYIAEQLAPTITVPQLKN